MDEHKAPRGIDFQGKKSEAAGSGAGIREGGPL